MGCCSSYVLSVCMHDIVDGKKNGTFQICNIDRNYSLNLCGSPGEKQSITQFY